jgi:predicted dehydrogenase
VTRVAVVGCGAVSEQCHLPALLPRVGRDGIWLVDPDAERRAGLAKRYGRARQTAASPAEIATEVDAAIVAVPNDLHAVVAGELLDAGVPVLCEKPLARTLAEAEALAARPSPLLAVAHVRRFFPSVRFLRGLLATEHLGRPLRFELEEGSPHGWSSASAYWLDRQRAGGGVLVDIGSHVLDLVRFWLGELEVERYADDAHGGVEANALVELSAGGVPGTVELSRTRALRGTIRVTCERGVIEAPTGHHGELHIGDERSVLAEPDAAGADGGYGHAFGAQIDDFLEALRGGSAPEVPAAEAVPVMAALDGCYAIREPLAEPWVTELLG